MESALNFLSSSTPTTTTRLLQKMKRCDAISTNFYLEMIAAGVRVFAGGLRPARNAKSLRAQPDGKVLITDGPFLETHEHVGGFGCWKPLT